MKWFYKKILKTHFTSWYLKHFLWNLSLRHGTTLMISQTLVLVMAWCQQATSHYLNQCWPWSMSPYGDTRPQWVNISYLKTFCSNVDSSRRGRRWQQHATMSWHFQVWTKWPKFCKQHFRMHFWYVLFDSNYAEVIPEVSTESKPIKLHWNFNQNTISIKNAFENTMFAISSMGLKMLTYYGIPSGAHSKFYDWCKAGNARVFRWKGHRQDGRQTTHRSLKYLFTQVPS